MRPHRLIISRHPWWNRVCVAALACAPLVFSVLGDSWPQWRGPAGQGHSEATGLPVRWSETENVTWKTPVPGRGHSSPVIANGKVWLTTATETPANPDEAKRRKVGSTNDQPINFLEDVRLRVVGIDLKTGAILHDVEVLHERDPQGVHALNTYASPTPVLNDGRLFAHFGTFGTACIDTKTGQIVWTNRDLRLNHENGPGSSPVLWGDFVIFHGDGSDVQFIAALHQRTGQLAWKTSRSGELPSHPQLKKAYGTPIVAEFAGKPELLSPAAQWLYSYDPATGRELWKLPYGVQGFSIVPRPILGPGMIYFATSFMRSELIAVKYDGSQPPEIAWRWKRGVPQTPSFLRVDNEIYFVSDAGGLLTCLDAATGKEHYQERLGGNFSSSPTYADGRIYVHDQEGVTTVLRPGTRFEVLARNTLDGPHMASLAIADTALFLRTDKALYRIENPKRP